MNQWGQRTATLCISILLWTAFALPYAWMLYLDLRGLRLEYVPDFLQCYSALHLVGTFYLLARFLWKGR
jgi:hypothetical protein